MKFSIPHKYSQSEALQRVRFALDHSRSQLSQHVSDLKEDWRGNTLNFGFTAQKQRIEGTLEITEKSFEVEAKLPFMLRMFEGRIQEMIKAEVAKLM